jgi:hypothetical protein
MLPKELVSRAAVQFGSDYEGVAGPVGRRHLCRRSLHLASCQLPASTVRTSISTEKIAPQWTLLALSLQENSRGKFEAIPNFLFFILVTCCGHGAEFNREPTR